MDIQAIKRKRYVYLFASAISFLVLGLVYGWSLFATPLAEIYGWEMSAVKMTFTFCMMAFCVGGLIGVKVLKGLGLRGAILLAAALLVCGFGGTALLAPQGIWALWICYGVLIGCGTGLGYNVTIASITPWFPDKSGFASGVMFAGFGLGSITLGTLTRGIIGAAGITVAFAVVAATAGTVMVILSLLLKRAPENIAEILGVTAKKTKTAPDADADNRACARLEGRCQHGEARETDACHQDHALAQAQLVVNDAHGEAREPVYDGDDARQCCRECFRDAQFDGTLH